MSKSSAISNPTPGRPNQVIYKNIISCRFLPKLFVYALFTFPLLLPAQITGVFSNPTSSILNDAIGYDPNNYPSNIEVTGMPEYLHEFAVRFMLLTGSFPDLDLLLEAPNGQRILLTSDLPYPFFDSFDFGIGTTGKDTLSPATLNDFYVFYPANYDDGVADIFPSPGPGTVAQAAYPDPLALQDIDPNGEWKLYLVDDTPDGSSTWLLDGWRLEITADDLPACKRPGKPNAVTEDFSATLDWSAGAGNTQWDLFVTQDFFLQPTDTTSPTQSSLFQNQNVVVDSLEPGLKYAAYVRANCGGGRTSPWVGPTIFKTTIHPCEMATPVALCEAVDFPTLPYYKNLFFPPGFQVWVFAFTPPDSGDYWMQFEGNSGYPPYYRLNNQNNCEDGQWTLMDSDFSEGLGYRMHNLVAGQTCWIIHHGFGLEHQIFRIERCPLRRMGVSGVSPFTDSLLVRFESAQNLGSSLDMYFGPKPLSSPDENTVPTYTGQNLDYSILGYNYAFRNLQPDTEYEFYIRRTCVIGQASCWQGPFFGKTAAIYSNIKSVHIDTVTYTWTNVTFSFDSIPDAWGLVVCQPGQNPAHGNVGGLNVFTPNDTSTVRLLSIPLTAPLQLYFKASKSGWGGQRWQGPYEIPAGTTPPLPINDLFCMEEGSTFPEYLNEAYTSFIDLPVHCASSDHGERIYRYRANQTDTVAISRSGGSGCNNCPTVGGCNFYYKSASELPDINNWKHIGCWIKPQMMDPLPDLKFAVEKDSVYYLLCNSVGSPGINHFSFKLYDCNITCATVDSITLETISPTSAVLRWNNTAPSGYYELSYYPVSGAASPQFVTTNDTSITLTGLLAAAQYTFKIRSFCSATDPSGLYTATLQTAKHTVSRESFIGRCNPMFLPAGGIESVNYDVFDLSVPESGDYRLTTTISCLNSYLYESVFDPENPTLNLLVPVVQTGGSVCKDALVSLEVDKAYKWVISGTQLYPASFSFNHNGYDNIKILAAGPGQAQIGTAKWKGVEPKPHGKIPVQINYQHSGACRDTSGWVHYYSYGDQAIVENDALMLSVKTDVDPEVMDNLPMALVNNPPSAILITNPPTEFLQNPDGWYAMNRFWGMLNILPSQQIDQDFLLRFYYTQTDYELMKTAVESEGGNLDSHEALYFHNIKGLNDYSNLSPEYDYYFVQGALAYDDDGYWQYVNGPEASTNTWRHGTFAGEHYAEMVVRGLDGGGGGASVNGRGIFDPVSKTIELEPDGAFKLSPNPNKGIFSVEWAAPIEPDISLRIVDPSGRLLWEEPSMAGSMRQNVKASDLPAGLYFLQMVTEGKVLAIEKFVKQ